MSSHRRKASQRNPSESSAHAAASSAAALHTPVSSSSFALSTPTPSTRGLSTPCTGPTFYFTGTSLRPAGPVPSPIKSELELAAVRDDNTRLRLEMANLRAEMLLKNQLLESLTTQTTELRAKTLVLSKFANFARTVCFDLVQLNQTFLADTTSLACQLQTDATQYKCRCSALCVPEEVCDVFILRPCGHTVCADCLRTKNATVECPCCRAPSKTLEILEVPLASMLTHRNWSGVIVSSATDAANYADLFHSAQSYLSDQSEENSSADDNDSNSSHGIDPSDMTDEFAEGLRAGLQDDSPMPL